MPLSTQVLNVDCGFLCLVARQERHTVYLTHNMPLLILCHGNELIIKDYPRPQRHKLDRLK